MARWMAMAEEAMVPAVDEGAELRASAEVAEAATVDEAKRRRGREAKCKRSTWPRCCAQSGACLCARRQPSQLSMCVHLGGERAGPQRDGARALALWINS